MPCTHEPARPAQTLHLHIGRDNIPTFKTTRLNLNARLIKNILVTVNNELKSSLKKISANILCVCFGWNFREKASKSYAFHDQTKCKSNRGEMEWKPFERSANTYPAADDGRED